MYAEGIRCGGIGRRSCVDGRQFQQTQVQVVVADSLRALKFESLGGAAGSGEQFKVHEGTMAHLRRLQLEGKIIEIDSAGIIRLR